MTDVLSRALPAPKRWQELESIAFDVFRKLWATNDAQLNGRGGQAQAGVDVYGTDRVAGLFTGVQCKGKDSDYENALTEAELRSEVAKALTFQPPLQAYVVLTTAPNDATIQKVAREISAEHVRLGLFEVQVIGWDTFRHYVAENQEVLLKYFADFAPVDVFSAMEEGRRDTARNFARLESLILRGQKPVALDVETAGADVLADRITEISRLIGDGSPTAALRSLQRILDDEGENASPLATYRLFASMGNAHYALNDELKAAEYFLKAYSANPDYPNAKATLALARMIEGDPDEAYRLASEAFEADPSSSRSAGILIESAPAQLGLEALEAMVGPSLRDQPDVKLQLALRARGLGDHDRHLKYAEDALLGDPNDWRAMSAVAEALMRPLADVEGLVITHALPSSVRADVERAVLLMSTAWTQLKRRESTRQGRHVAANLITILEILGQSDEADVVFEEAVSDNPDYPPFILRSAQRFASKGEWQSAADKLDLDQTEEMPLDGILLRAQAASVLGDAAAAVQALQILTERSAVEGPQLQRDELIAALKVRVAILQGEDNVVAVEAAIAGAPSSIVLRSFLLDDLPEDHPLKAQISREIVDLAKGDLNVRERFFAAETLQELEEFSLAADIYSSLHDGTDSPGLRRHLQALYLADRRAEARRLFESLPPELRTKPGYLAVGINIYEKSGLLVAALELLDQALRGHDVLHNRLIWLQVLVRLGRRDQAIAWLKEVSDAIEGEPENLMMLARLIDQFVGRDVRALAFGYRALRAAYNRSDIHLGYVVGLIINGRPDESALAPPQELSVGTGVHLVDVDSGEELFRIIEDDDDTRIERGELKADDPFARRLLGLKVGDTIEAQRAGKTPRQLRVSEIQSRYLFAMRRTLRDFANLFPDNPAFGTFDIDEAKGEKKFDEMFQLARRRAEQGKSITAMYESGPLPLAMFAKFAGASVFDVWETLIRSSEPGLKVSIGLATEFNEGRAAAKSGILVVEPLTLYAWSRLELDRILEKANARLAVVQSTIDCLRELLEERISQRGRQMGTFGWNGEHFEFVELSDAALNAQIEAAEKALALSERLLLVPAESETTLPNNANELLDDFHDAYRDSILASLGRHRALITDDLALRAMASASGASTAWTQVLAQAAHEDSRISHPEYRAVVTSLISSNYQMTQFGSSEILGELQDAHWEKSQNLTNFINTLINPTLDRPSIAGVLAHLLIDSYVVAPDDASFAAFHVALVNTAKEKGVERMIAQDYANALTLLRAILSRKFNAAMLPARLLGSTSLSPPSVLGREAEELASHQAGRIVARLKDGGFWDAIPSPATTVEV